MIEIADLLAKSGVEICVSDITSQPKGDVGENSGVYVGANESGDANIHKIQTTT